MGFLNQLHSANVARPFSSCPITPASTGAGGKKNKIKKTEVHISVCKSSLALPQTIRSIPWVNWGQFSHACFSRYSLLYSQALQCTACMCAHSCCMACWGFKPVTLPLCSWVYSPTAFMLSASFMTPGFCFSLPAATGPLYIRQYCLNCVYLSPVIQKTHSCCSFILPVIFNSNVQAVDLKIIVSPLTVPLLLNFTESFWKEASPVFLFLYIFLIPQRNPFYADE